MSVLHTIISNITLQMKPCQWLLDEVLANNLSMKQNRISFSEYNKALPMDIYVLRRRERALEEEEPKTDDRSDKGTTGTVEQSSANH